MYIPLQDSNGPVPSSLGARLPGLVIHGRHAGPAVCVAVACRPQGPPTAVWRQSRNGSGRGYRAGWTRVAGAPTYAATARLAAEHTFTCGKPGYRIPDYVVSLEDRLAIEQRNPQKLRSMLFVGVLESLAAP